MTATKDRASVTPMCVCRRMSPATITINPVTPSTACQIRISRTLTMSWESSGLVRA